MEESKIVLAGRWRGWCLSGTEMKDVGYTSGSAEVLVFAQCEDL
jgi:hypothetical protein